ncbi:periplasmic heavy metal sensor [Aromatoleum anaerobium]|uniref:Periplasmic heavy metal sensor n=2 Tax=Aromatoleum TaxID=551759 RepID=A0ABX1PN53_9RHOO|nr:periplasmic heavy metal sensor [Aromatoleum anaerobium]MCK0509133.1 periplasmic heavy metal sensor [Aromatoleum anaerobium]
MKPSTLRFALMCSVLVNLGVVAAAGVHVLRPASTNAGAAPSLPVHLGLDARQLERWHAAEQPFLRQFGDAAARIDAHRTEMIHAIFAPNVDRKAIEAERVAIARLQHEQQRLMIEQLLAEREILDEAQRARLAQLLLAQPAKPSLLEDLHAR